MMASRATAQPAAAPTDQPSGLLARMVPPMPGSALWGWLGPLLVTAFGAFLRFNRLSKPDKVIFDETYYVPDALGILRYGVEHNYVSARNSMLVRGNTHIFTTGGEFVVHPPVGKLFIAFGEWTFGVNSFGWRFAAALIGSLAILLLARIARRMTRSTLLGCIAGLLMALDGLEFVMSRTALLDIFLMFWVLAAFGCLVVDRDVTRARLAAAVAGTAGGDLARDLASGDRWRRPGTGPRGRPGWRSDPLVAGGRRGLHRPGPGVEVGRDLVRARPDRAGHRLGRRRAPGRRAAQRSPRHRAAAPLAAGLVRRCCPSPCTWSPGPAGSSPAPDTTGSGPRRTATTSR